MACSLLMQLSSRRSRCKLGESFGCALDAHGGPTMFVSGGCRGQFLCGSAAVACGFELQSRNGNYTCDCRTCDDAREGLERDQGLGHRGSFDSTCLPASSLPSFCPRQSPHRLPLPLWASPPALVVDVGAHDGRDAVAFTMPGHRVLAFEPSPRKAAQVCHYQSTSSPVAAHYAAH